MLAFRHLSKWMADIDNVQKNASLRLSTKQTFVSSSKPCWNGKDFSSLQLIKFINLKFFPGET